MRRQPEPRRARRAAERRHPPLRGIGSLSHRRPVGPGGARQRACGARRRAGLESREHRPREHRPAGTVPRLSAMGARSVPGRTDHRRHVGHRPARQAGVRRCAGDRPEPPVHGLRRRIGGRRAVVERARPHVPAGCGHLRAGTHRHPGPRSTRDSVPRGGVRARRRRGLPHWSADTRARLGLELRGGAPGPQRHAGSGRSRGAARGGRRRHHAGPDCRQGLPVGAPRAPVVVGDRSPDAQELCLGVRHPEPGDDALGWR